MGNMTRDELQRWIDKKGPTFIKTLRTMCKMYIQNSWKIKINCQIGGGSWCSVDHNSHDIVIQIGLPEWILRETPNRQPYIDVLGYEPGEKEALISLRELGMHEFGHACLTRPGNMFHRIALLFPKVVAAASSIERDMYLQYVVWIIAKIFNAVEDPRIENILKARFKIAEEIDFGRILDHEIATTPSKSKIWNFMYALLQIGCVGKYPKFPIEPEAVKAIEAIRNVPLHGSKKTRDLYGEFLVEADPEKANALFESFFKVPAFHDYVAKLIYEEVEEGKTPGAKALRQMFNGEQQQEVRIVRGSGKGGIPIDLKGVKVVACTASGKKGEEGEKNNGQSGGSTSQKPDGEKPEKGQGTAAGEHSEEEKKAENQADGEEANGEQNGQNGKDGSSANSQSSNPSTQQESTPEEHDTFDDDGNWQLNQGDGEANELEELREDDDLRERLNELIESLDPKLTRAIQTAEPKASKTKNVNKGCSAEVEIDTSFSPSHFAPSNVVRAAKPLRSAIMKLMADNVEEDIYDCRSGSLDTESLYRLAQSDPRIFRQHRLPVLEDAVYYVCWDGSGSMYGSKQSESAYACAVVEEALRGVPRMSLKIINFSTHGKVVHYVVKDFSTKTKKNCAYSFGAQRSFSGGNKDGFSIRQCTNELIARPEARKFLIVLSDGAPSDYSSHQEATNDVKSAVAFARQNNIDVTSIFFGTQRERDNEIDLYREMYGAGHIISCDPSEIVSHMVNIVKKTTFC